MTTSTSCALLPSPVFHGREYCQALWCPFLYGIAYTSPFGGPRSWHAHRCARRRSNDHPQRTRRRKWRSGRNLRFAPQLLLAPPLRRRLRPRNRKRQPIAAAYAFRLPLRAQPRLSTHTVLQPQAVVPLATIKCSSAFDEKRFAKGTSLMFATPPGSQKELR